MEQSCVVGNITTTNSKRNSICDVDLIHSNNLINSVHFIPNVNMPRSK